MTKTAPGPIWDEGNFSSLIMEGNMIQRCFNNTHKKMPNDDARIGRTFADLMHKGKIHSATQLLSKKEAKGVLNLDDKLMANQFEKFSKRNTHQPSQSTLMHY